MTLTLLATHPEAAAETTALARSLTALHASHDRIWAGYGDTFNNTGPTSVRGWNPAAGAWDGALTFSTDRAGRFRLIGSQCWNTMDDPTAAQNWGYGVVAGATANQFPLNGNMRNLLTANQSSVETDMTGLRRSDAEVNRDRSLAQAFNGSASIGVSRATATAGPTNGGTLGGIAGLSVEPGKIYRCQARVWTPASRTYRIDLVYYDATGVEVSRVQSAAGTFASGWSQFPLFAGMVPSGVAFAAIDVVCTTLLTNADAMWHIDSQSIHEWNYAAWTLGGTSASASFRPAHTYDLCERVAGEIYAVGAYGVTARAGLARSTDGGTTWEPVLYALDTAATGAGFARFYNVAALNGTIYTVLGGATGSGSTEQYVHDVGDPCYTYTGKDAGRGPVLNGFIHPQHFAGRLVYRGADDRLRSFNGQSVADHRAAKLHAVGAGLCWVVDGSTLYSSPDLSTWTDRGAAPATATSLAVAA